MAAQHAPAGDYSTRYKFNGKELDQATGLYYYGARYYDPKISTWLSVDPLAEKYQAYSPYNYTLNNPINLIDPDGRSVDDWIKNLKTGIVSWVNSFGDTAIKEVAVSDGNMSLLEVELSESVKAKYENLGSSFFGTRGKTKSESKQIYLQQIDYLHKTADKINANAKPNYPLFDFTYQKLKSAFLIGNIMDNAVNSGNNSKLKGILLNKGRDEISQNVMKRIFSLTSKAAGAIYTTLFTVGTANAPGTMKKFTLDFDKMLKESNQIFNKKVLPYLDRSTLYLINNKMY